MTILNGVHTIAELEDLAKTVEFRIAAGNKVNAQITQPQITSNLDAYTDLESDWTKFRVRWATARDPALTQATFLSASNPLVPKSLIPAESQYQTLKRAINVQGGDTYQKGDLTDCLNRIEQFAGMTIDEKDHPMPTGFDPDLAIYTKLDNTIKAGEAAAAAAKSAAGTVATGVPTWMYVAGVLGITAVGYAYTRPFLPRR